MSPVPDGASPIRVLEFVQLICAPATLLNNGILMACPGQNCLSTIAVTTGSGLIVMRNEIAGPLPRFFVPVTEMFAVIGLPETLVAAVNEVMLPLPLAPRLMAGLSLVQLNATPPETTFELNAGTTMV